MSRPAARPGPGARAALALIHLYQGLHHGQLSRCRFVPSCSAYAEEAIHEHGLWVGGRLALRRLSRCRPLGPHGIDLVPVPVQSRARAGGGRP